MNDPRKDLVKVSGIALAYFGTLFISFLYPDVNHIFMTVWPAAGVGLAALLLNPRRLWPLIALAIFVAGNAANFIEHRPFVNSLGFMIANVAESLGCAWVMTSMCANRIRFERTPEVFSLIIAAVLVNAVTACLGSGVAALSSPVPFWHFWCTWWIADGIGILVITPLVVAMFVSEGRLKVIRWGRMAEVVAFFVLWIAASLEAFNPVFISGHAIVLPYMLMALLVWPAVRFGLIGVMIAILILMVIGISSANVSAGPLLLGGNNFEERLQQIQLYLGFTAVTGMLLAVSFTERRLTERTLKEGKDRYDRLVANIPVGIYVAHSTREGMISFVFVSSRMAHMLDLSVESILADPQVVFRPVHPDDRESLLCKLKESAMRPELFEWEGRIVIDGTVKWLRISSLPEQGGDGGTLWSGVIAEITGVKTAERLALEVAAAKASVQVAKDKAEQISAAYEELKQVKDQLVQAEKMASLGILSAGVAHELNNPLTGILGITRHYLANKDPNEKEHKDLEQVVIAAERMAVIIRSLLTFSRASVGMPENVDCNAVVDAALSLGQSILIGPDIEVRKDLAAALPLVKAGKNRLEQVAVIIINNAADAMKQSGVLKITTRVARTGEKDFVEMEFTDNGCGIKKENFTRIFDPFFTTKSPGKGTGLGLSVAYSIVKEYAGEIRVESPPAGQEHGSSFTVRLPA